MLKIRFFRTGKKNQPFFKIVVTDKRKPPRGGSFVEQVGFYNPLTKEKKLKTERVKYWLSVGAKPSDTVYNLLIKEGILQGKKIPLHKKKKEEKKEEIAPAGERAAERKSVASPAGGAEEKETAPEKPAEAEEEKKTEEKPEEKPKEEKKESASTAETATVDKEEPKTEEPKKEEIPPPALTNKT